MCISRATVSAVSCLVVPAFICTDLLILRVLKINDDDDDKLPYRSRNSSSAAADGGLHVQRRSVAASDANWRIEVNYAFPSPTATRCCSCYYYFLIIFYHLSANKVVFCNKWCHFYFQDLTEYGQAAGCGSVIALINVYKRLLIQCLHL